MLTEYNTPEILQDSDEDVIHKRMLDMIPDELDKSEGGHVWDLTRPTAIEIAEFKGFTLDLAVRMIFPQFSTGEILDYHGEARGLVRKDPITSSGMLTVTGEPGTVINENDLFSTMASGEEDQSVSFAATGNYTIPESGSVNIEIECVEGGVVGNVSANSIVMIETANDGIYSCNNELSLAMA